MVRDLRRRVRRWVRDDAVREALVSEASFLKEAMLALSKRGDTVFRNHVGTGVFGRFTRIQGTGDVLVHDARVAECGLFVGSADILGWRSVVVTPDMVGKRVAVFLSVETKAPRGRATEAQKNWAATVREAGGISGIVRKLEELP